MAPLASNLPRVIYIPTTFRTFIENDTNNTPSRPRPPLSKSRTAVKARRMRLMSAVLDGRPLKQAGIEAGYSPDNAGNIASGTLASPVAQQSMGLILENEGLGALALTKKMKSLLDAEYPIYIQYRGAITDKVMSPALSIQHKTLETALKVGGHLSDKKELDIRVGIMAMVVDALNTPSPSKE